MVLFKAFFYVTRASHKGLREMPLAVVGINHHTAPLSLRERLALTDSQQGDLLNGPLGDTLRRHAGLAEFVFLSTCNRTELYTAAPRIDRPIGEAPRGLLDMLAQHGGLEPAELAPHGYTHVGGDALRHLCRVASGLDSMVLGESEILGQVGHALEMAKQLGTVGPIIEEAFHTAVRAGRRARTETGICHHPASVSTEAVRLLADVAGPLDQLTVLIVGTGKMGRLAGEALRAYRVRHLRVISRTAEHAAEVARAWGADALAWHELSDAIGDADAIISSTGAPHAVLTRELIERARMNGNGARRRVFVDIAVPRDVEREVAELPNTEVYDLDALQARLEGNLELRRREVPAVERIIEEELRHFDDWRRGAVLRPLLAEMHARGEAIRERELAKMLRRLGDDVSPELKDQLEAFSRSLVNKLLHEPTRRLRETSDPERARTYTHLTRELFGLDGGRAAGGSAA